METKLLDIALHFLSYDESIKFWEYEISKEWRWIEIKEKWEIIWVIQKNKLYFKPGGWFRESNFEMAIEKYEFIFLNYIEEKIEGMKEKLSDKDSTIDKLKREKSELEDTIAKKIADTTKHDLENIF